MTSANQKIKLGLVQMSMVADAEENRKKAAALVKEAATKGAHIVCLPELFTTPYFCNVQQDARPFAESIPGASSSFLSETAAANKVVLVGGSFYEKAGEQFFNTALIYSETGALLGTYRKIHIPQDEGFFEKEYFTPGDLGYLAVDTSVGKIAVLICYDQWFPEAARMLALQGVEVIFYPTAIGNVSYLEQHEGNWQEAWENVQRGHAIANGIVVAGVNRVGTEKDTTFWGGSFVCNAFGKTLVRGDATEQVLIAEIDRQHGKTVQEGWGFLRNRRPDTYGPLAD